ncbi:UNKNOWN [Stylonychia lemnae]|uniref:Uncharacterized protein n=1 Tax=Stylonychia lemnae TaxID=5949 RepID=A0A078A4H1_STYLE|nr:UNKNOWN [Stylonychia lemnae]|eukprot:CDW77153.1 UNKNOWN [Stylonychia lemnae]
MTHDVTTCYSQIPKYGYPGLLGGSQSNTQFECLDYDSNNQNILIGGWSSSSDLVGSAYPKNPIILRINENNGRVIWDIKIQNIGGAQNPLMASRCAIQDTAQQYVVAISTISSINVFIMQYSNGLLKFSYVLYNTATFSSSLFETGIDVKMDSAEKIYLLSKETGLTHLSIFQFTGATGSITATFYYEYGDNSLQVLNIATAKFHPNFDYLYIGGNYQGDLALIKINIADGTFLTGTAVPQSGTSSNELISQIGIYIDSSLDPYQVACAQNLGTGNDIGLMYFKQLFDGTSQLLYTWYLTMTYPTYCLAVNYDGVTMSYLLYESQRSRNYFGTRSVSSATNFDLREIYYAFGNGLLNAQNAYLDTSGLFFIDIGSLLKINSNQYSQSTAYLGRFPVGQSCISSSSNTNTFTSIYQDSFITGNFQQQTLIALTPLTLSFELQEDSTVDSQALTSLKLAELPAECLDYVFGTGNVNSPVIGNRVYNVGDPALTIFVSQFTYTEPCIDTPTWVYQGLQSDYSPLPSFIQFIQISYGSYFRVETSDQQNAATYQLLVEGTASGQYIGYSFFELYVSSTGGSVSPLDNILRTYENRAPYFASNLDEIIQIKCREKKIIKIPDIVDPDLDQVSLVITQQIKEILPGFILLKDKRLIIEPQNLDYGNYTLLFKLTDDNLTFPMTNFYQVIIVVKSTYQILKQRSPPIIPNHPNNSVDTMNETIKSQNVEMTIKSINEQGQARILIKADNSIDSFQLKNYLTSVQILNSLNELAYVEYNITGFQDGIIVLQLLLDDAQSISRYQSQDQLIISYFKQRELITKIRNIPPQTKNDVEQKLVNSLQQVTDSILTSVLYGSIGMSLVFGTSLQLLWGLVNTLQLMSHTPLMAIPYNMPILSFLKTIFTVVTFDPIDRDLVSNIFAITFGTVVILICLILPIILRKFNYDYKNRKLKEYLDEIIDPLSDNGAYSSLYYSVFIIMSIRRQIARLIRRIKLKQIRKQAQEQLKQKQLTIINESAELQLTGKGDDDENDRTNNSPNIRFQNKSNLSFSKSKSPKKFNFNQVINNNISPIKTVSNNFSQRVIQKKSLSQTTLLTSSTNASPTKRELQRIKNQEIKIQNFIDEDPLDAMMNQKSKNNKQSLKNKVPDRSTTNRSSNRQSQNTTLNQNDSEQTWSQETSRQMIPKQSNRYRR